MNLRRPFFWFLIFSLLAAAGCAPLSPSPSGTTVQPQKSMPAPALTTPAPTLPTRTTLPTSTSTPVPSPTITASLATPGPVHPILVFPPYSSSGGFLLGASRDRAWLAADEAAALLQPQETYALYSVQERQGSAVSGVLAAEPLCPSFWSVPIEHPAGLAAAIGADWNALPRVPQEVDLNDPGAVQQVRDFLIAQAISQPEVKIQRILRVDLEGDGKQEVLVGASRFIEETGHDTSPGDYSIIVLYREGQAAMPVVNDSYTQAGPLTFPDRFDLSAVLDLNGDGRLEILVAITGWEKTGAQAYTFDGAMLENVLQARCP